MDNSKSFTALARNCSVTVLVPAVAPAHPAADRSV